MMPTNLTDNEWDGLLRDALRESSDATHPDLAPALRQQIVHDQLRRVRMPLFVCLAIFVLAMMTITSIPSNRNLRNSEKAHIPISNTVWQQSLFTEPPVASFDVLAMNQDAYLSAMNRMIEEFPK